MTGLDQARDQNLLPKFGASTYTITRGTIENLPQADNTPIDKVILQMPGVSYDSAVSNPSFHVRGEYANVQTRINGVVVPEAFPASARSSTPISSAACRSSPAHCRRNMACAPPASSTSPAAPLPRRAAKSAFMAAAGNLYAELRLWRQGRQFGIFRISAGDWNDLGIENPTPGLNAIHDETQQGKFFGYVSTLLDEFDPPQRDLGRVLQRVPDSE